MTDGTRRQPERHLRREQHDCPAPARARLRSMTLDVYSDLFDEDLDAMARPLDERLVRAFVGKLWSERAAKTSRAPPISGPVKPDGPR